MLAFPTEKAVQTPLENFKILIHANAFSCLMLAKFGLIGLYDYATGSTYFGQYSLAYGLVVGFFALAGCQARMFVLSQFKDGGDFAKLQIILVAGGLLAGTLSIILNFELPALNILCLICLQRGLENIMLARASFTQIRKGRHHAFQKLNLYGLVVFLGYATCLYWSLWAALILEILAIVAIIWVQRLDIGKLKFNTEQSFINIGLIGLAYSLSAGLNAGLNSVLLYFGYLWFSVADAMILAQILVLQAIIARFMASNSIYFIEEISNNLARYKYLILILWAALSSLFLSIFAIQNSLVVIGIIFTSINLINIVLRQHVMSTREPSSLVQIHSLELMCFVLSALIFANSIETLFFIYASIRMLRIPALLVLLKSFRHGIAA